MSMGELIVKYGVFLADQCNSIGDLVSQSVSEWVTFDFTFFRELCVNNDNDKGRDRGRERQTSIGSDLVIQWLSDTVCLLTNWETEIMSLRVAGDWHSDSDLDSIRNSCDVKGMANI